jgi:hypothetical protein
LRPDGTDRGAGEKGNHRFGRVGQKRCDPVAAGDAVRAQCGGERRDPRCEFGPGNLDLVAGFITGNDCR